MSQGDRINHDVTMAEIGDLPNHNLANLRQLWQELYRSEPPVRMSRELLMQAIAYRLQERSFGGLSRAARLKLAGKTGASRSASVPKRSRAKTRRTVKAGTRFLREWQGRTHEVTVSGDGRFLYAGASYRSLSEIARQITGTRWSGPAFFGLTQNTRASHGKT
jgi:hypothetical protein